MSKIKKISISIVLGLIFILGMYSVSNAYYIGQDVNITYNQYESSSNIFCMEHWQRLSTSNAYTIVSNVKIDGLKSTDHKGKSIDSKYNARFAYIIGASKTRSKSSVSNAVWNFGYTWMQNVGKNHAGLYSGFASSVKGGAETINAEASKYANGLDSIGKIEDKTSKKNIQVQAYKKDNNNYVRVGPFKWNFGGTMSNVKAYDQDNKSISNLLYSTFEGSKEKFIDADSITSGKEFYISIAADSGVSKITSIKGIISINLKTANIWFLKAKAGYKQNLIIVSPGERSDKIETSLDYEIDLLGDLKVIKVDRDNHEKRLSGVGFYIKNKATEKYVKKSGNTISYVENRDKATEFITDNNGEIKIENLIVGDYIAYETKTNAQYELIKNGIPLNVTIDKTKEQIIENTQVAVSVSGYVWIDEIFGKQAGDKARNSLYKVENSDENDMLFNGITVRLMRNGKEVSSTVTSKKDIYINELSGNDGNGEYLFENVPLYDEKDTEKKKENIILNQYYIEFEYDGLKYTNVIPYNELEIKIEGKTSSEIEKIRETKASKAAESTEDRSNFSEKFAVVEKGNDKENANTGITRKGNETSASYNLTYDTESIDKATLITNNPADWPITASTKTTKYSLKDNYKYGQEEIKYINLGLYKRERPDMALVKDVSSIKMSVNGYNHVYEYAKRYINGYEATDDDFNVGVKYKNAYTGDYNAAIYKSDYDYKSPDGENELEVYITYQIRLVNESDSLNTKINSIVEYFDSQYDVYAIGTELDENKDVKNISSWYNKESIVNLGNGYSKLYINNDTELGYREQKDIFVQFKLSKDAVKSILEDDARLDNVAEIASYSIYDRDGKIYAGIDEDSNPENNSQASKIRSEDDTSTAPGILLELKDERVLKGTVYEDSYGTSSEIKSGEVRQGNGVFDKGNENVISGVKVILTETSGSGKSYDTTTDQDGNFVISNYIPGKYKLQYIWGDSEHPVTNYKATIWTTDNKNEKESNGSSWYKINVDTRYSDALDDYNIRTTIDNQIANGIDVPNDTKMEANANEMEITLELTSVNSSYAGDKFRPADYEVKNIDFGIIERAKQEITLIKRVSAFKATLANGQVISNITINEDGSLSGEKRHLTYMGPSANASPSNGFLKLELDNELIQGATIEITYEIKAMNNSELDYVSEKFYNYGIVDGNKVTISPSAIVDYLDQDWAFENDKNSQWKVVTKDELKNIVAEEVYTSNTIDDKIILYSESLKNNNLTPPEIINGKVTYVDGESTAALYLNVSKVLANSDEISLNNETEITKTTKEWGRPISSTPGNYIPGEGPQESDDSQAETVIVTPSTGDNFDFVIPVTVSLAALVILGVGVVVIRKKAL